MSSIESSSDFWNDEYDETKSIGVSANISLEKIEVPAPDLPEELLKIYPDDYSKNRSRHLLDQIRIGLKADYENKLGQELRKQDREFRQKTQELIATQRNELLNMKKDYDSLKNLLIAKDNQITKLQQMLIDQEFPISKQRLYRSITKAQIFNEKFSQSDEKNEFELDIKAKDLQLLGMKELVKSYQEQTEKAKKDLVDCELKLKETIEGFENKIKEIHKENEEQCAKLNNIIDSINQNYRLFKEEVKKEFELNQIVIKQQFELNSSLKKELKSAKLVLVTPRLREKFNSKVSERDFSLENPSRLKVKNLHKRESTLDYLISTRASPAERLSPDLNTSVPVCSLPDINHRSQPFS